jgi:peroxiredoxin Q/BCP
MLVKSLKYIFVAYLTMSLCVINMFADEKSVGLDIGDQVPSFTANDDEGNLWDLKDHLGEKLLVMYFYPAAMTGGCTKQACGYRDSRNNLAELNIEVIGVSGDPVRNLQIFKKAHNLNFTLLSDVHGIIAEKFGVPSEKGKSSITRELNGKDVSLDRLFTEARWTFVIDKSGKIIYKDTNVNAENDSQNIINFLKDFKR